MRRRRKETEVARRIKGGNEKEGDRSSQCGARGGFLPRHYEDLREPLVRRQGSQVSMRLARGLRW